MQYLKRISLSRAKEFLRREIFLERNWKSSFLLFIKNSVGKTWRTWCQNCRIAIISRINIRLTYNSVQAQEFVERWNLNGRFIAGILWLIIARISINNIWYMIVDYVKLCNTNKSIIICIWISRITALEYIINDRWIYLYRWKFTLKLNKREH